MRVLDLFFEDKTADVIRIQKELNRLGASIRVDGVIGTETLLALYRYIPEALPKDVLEKLQKVHQSKTQRSKKSQKDVAGGNAFDDPEFIKKLKSVAKSLGIHPNVLAAMIQAESRGDPAASDPYNVSAGLIGFTRGTAKKLGTSREEILQMSAIEQLDLIEKYYRQIGAKPGMDRGTLYMLTFLPAFANSSNDTVLGQEGGGELVTPGGTKTGLSMHKVWYQNPIFARSKGQKSFTVGDVKKHINALQGPNIEESVNEADINPVDTIELDVPLLLRMMEYAREDAKTDMDLHDVTEKMIHLSKTGETLSMAQYDDIVGDNEEPEPKPTMPGPEPAQQEAIGGSSAEEFLKSVEYRPRHQAKPKRTLMGDPVREGHGRYWCSTDKRWKERQGPKQSRS